MPHAITNEDLGYTPFFESSRESLGFHECAVARVIVVHRGSYTVKNADGEYTAKVTGKQMFTATSRETYPTVGDWVVIEELNAEQAVIQAVLPRQTLITRKHGDKSRNIKKSETQVIGANIDVAFIVESLNRDFSINRFERYFVIAKEGGVRPVIILNKIDLVSTEELNTKIAEIQNRFGDVEIITTSVIRDDGLHELKQYIEKRKTYCFLGSSGVGKSSLINALLEKEIVETGDISEYAARGKHTTTRREMYFLKNGGIVIDNPGMREVGVADADSNIDACFDEITALGTECKFANCTHIHEPGCRVLTAVESGELDAEKYANYINLKKESEHYEATELEKKEKERQFGKFLKTAKKTLKKYKG
jgi:ribosome biogenesis GTPase / thiamine phosphate phosphatase